MSGCFFLKHGVHSFYLNFILIIMWRISASPLKYDLHFATGYPPQMRRDNTFSRACVSVSDMCVHCVSDLILVRMYIFAISKSSSYIKVIGASWRLREQRSVSVHIVRALTFESLDLQTSLLICRYILIMSKSRPSIKVIWSRSRSHERNTHAGSLSSSEMQSCSENVVDVTEMDSVDFHAYDESARCCGAGPLVWAGWMNQQLAVSVFHADFWH